MGPERTHAGDIPSPADRATDDTITTLAKLPTAALLSTKALSSIFGRDDDSIRYAVKAGYLPPPILLFGQHWWLAGKIITHLETRMDQARAQADKERQAVERKVTQLRRGE